MSFHCQQFLSIKTKSIFVYHRWLWTSPKLCMKYWNHFTTWIRKSVLLENYNAFYILHVSAQPFPVTALLIKLIFNFAVLNFLPCIDLVFQYVFIILLLLNFYLLHWKSCSCAFLPPLLFHPLNVYWSVQAHCVQKVLIIHVYWKR